MQVDDTDPFFLDGQILNHHQRSILSKIVLDYERNLKRSWGVAKLRLADELSVLRRIKKLDEVLHRLDDESRERGIPTKAELESGGEEA